MTFAINQAPAVLLHPVKILEETMPNCHRHIMAQAESISFVQNVWSRLMNCNMKRPRGIAFPYCTEARKSLILITSPYSFYT